jgi:hypothetical protein
MAPCAPGETPVNPRDRVPGLAAEITNTPGDFSNLDPMITATLDELERAGVVDRPQVALADARYRNERHMDELIANKHIQVKGGETELIGYLEDPSALFGVLAEIEALGLELLELRQIPTGPKSP